jgi:hypothetical protein
MSALRPLSGAKRTSASDYCRLLDGRRREISPPRARSDAGGICNVTQTCFARITVRHFLAFDTSKLGQWGSLFLDDLAPIIGKSARLQQEIDGVLSEGNKRREAVTCFGMRFPGQWKTLGGYRVSPYTCDFGAMWLQIHATDRITDRRGQAFETITTKAMNNATNVSETNLNWKWTTEFPPEVPTEMREWIGPRG